jgi:hypothetical protein
MCVCVCVCVCMSMCTCSSVLKERGTCGRIQSMMLSGVLPKSLLQALNTCGGHRDSLRRGSVRDSCLGTRRRCSLSWSDRNVLAQVDRSAWREPVERNTRTRGADTVPWQIAKLMRGSHRSVANSRRGSVRLKRGEPMVFWCSGMSRGECEERSTRCSRSEREYWRPPIWYTLFAKSEGRSRNLPC